MQVPAGTYSVEARLVGYATDTKSATIIANQTTTVNFMLTPADVYLDVTANPERIRRVAWE